MKKFSLILITSGILFSRCADHTIQPENEPNLRSLSASEVQISESSNDFAFSIFNKLQKQPYQNQFISPLSISVALAMALNGADDDTKQSILSTINFTDLTDAEVNQGYKDLIALLLTMDNKVNVGLANSVWFSNEYKVNSAFASLIKDYYSGEVRALNFSDANAKNTINNWVEQKTNQRIKNLINDISPYEVMFIINAIYFKGDWTYQFTKSETRQAPFTRLDGSTTSVSLMHSKGAKILHNTTSQLQLVDVPYGNGQFSFTVLMPHSPQHYSEVAEQINASGFSELLADADTLTIGLELPKFKLTWKKDLKETLELMGMKTNGFSRLFDEPLPLAISRVIHQSFIEVNEEGSEAAAATAIGIELTSAPSKPSKITIDKPFLFIIRERHSGVILFVGQFIDPQDI